MVDDVMDVQYTLFFTLITCVIINKIKRMKLSVFINKMCFKERVFIRSKTIDI
jgi:hypothetical protein